MSQCASWAFALALTATPSFSQADKSPHKWTEFETVAGQPYPVPKRWLSTPNGRLTHNIVLPDSMPKPVPYDFTKAKLRALVPFSPSVSEQYWRHLCATEAGQYIFKTVKPVEGLALMRISTVPFNKEDEADFDSWLYEAGFIEIYLSQRNRPENIAGLYLHWPSVSYRNIEIPSSDGTVWTRFSRTTDEISNATSEDMVSSGKWHKSTSTIPTEKFSMTWRGLVRPHDRENRIAGFEIIVFDRESKEVLSVLRNFHHSTRSWRNEKGCDEMYSYYASPGDMPDALLALRTLQNNQPATFLQSNDERVSRRAARQ